MTSEPNSSHLDAPTVSSSSSSPQIPPAVLSRRPYLILAAMERARRLAESRQRDVQVVGDAGQDVTCTCSSETTQSEIAPIAQVEVRGASGKRKRQVQHVVTKQERLAVVKWMIAANEKSSRFLFKRTIDAFPGCFRAASASANYMKASRWWNNREGFLAACAEPTNRMSVQALQPGIRKHVMLKALPGRGRRRDPWTAWLHDELLDEFHRLRKAGLKMSPSMLVSVAQHILTNSHHEEYTRTFIPPGSDVSLYDRLNIRWVQTFMDRFDIVQRKQAGKKQLSPQKQIQIEKEVAFHMGMLKRGFESGEFANDRMGNMDETHFIVDMDNGKTLSFKGDQHIRYADVVSGTTGMTMVVLLLGGCSARIGTPVMIFSNPSCNYPIRGVPDDVPGVTYRTAQKGYMTPKVFAKWLGERRVIRRLPREQKMILWADNYSGHALSEQVNHQLDRLNAEVRFFPANATHLVQPADAFVISKINDAWTKRWEAKKVEMIRDGEWQNDIRSDGSWSGALRNPGKTFFLNLAADAVRDVNKQRTKKGNITYAQKAMVRCGLATVNGKWSVDQLSHELQYIIAEHYDHFMGKPVEGTDASTQDQSCERLEASV